MKNKKKKMSKEDFVFSIIGCFEEFLYEKNVTIENEERPADDEYAAIIYGNDYDYLHDQILDVFENFKHGDGS